jgi:DNA-directed RNA polymerase subunit E'/Rpb7
MESEALFEQRVSITAQDQNQIGKITDQGEKITIDHLLLDKIRHELESKCSKHGFVLKNTIEILARSLGRVENGRFTGSFIYNVQAKGKVLTPVDGYVVEGTVLKKNKMGMYVFHRDAFRIMVPRDLHLNRQDYEDVQVGATVKVELKKSRFQMKDPFIVSVGLLRTPETTDGEAQLGAVPSLQAEPESEEEVGVGESKEA